MNGKEAPDVRLGIRAIRGSKNDLYWADIVLSCGSSTTFAYGLSKQNGTGRMNTIFVPHLKIIGAPCIVQHILVFLTPPYPQLRVEPGFEVRWGAKGTIAGPEMELFLWVKT